MEWIVGTGLFIAALSLWSIDATLDRIASSLEAVSDQLAQEYEGDDPEAGE